MSQKKTSEVKKVNEAIGSYKEVEKMVRQIIWSDENISEEGKGVLKEYFVSAWGLNNMFQEKMAEPVLVGNRPTKVIRDNKTKIQKINSSESNSDGDSSTDIEICSTDDESFEKEKRRKSRGRGSYKKKFKCDICAQEINSLNNLKTHMKSKHGKTDFGVEKVEENKRKKEKKEKNNKNGEGKDKESKSEKKNCEDAGKSTKETIKDTPAKILELNKKKDNPNVEESSQLFAPEKNIPCDVCSEKFYNAGSMLKHKEYVHK